MSQFTNEVIGPLTDTELRATPVPISGTVTATGPLTDTQLRATPVPISGTVTATGPLTDTQLRATPVPVSGTVTATGPLTDTQLRATAVPVSGPLTDTQLRATAVPVSISGTVATTVGSTTLATVTNVSVGIVALTLSASNAAKSKMIVYNETGTLFVKLGAGASATSYSYRLTANTLVEFSGYAGIVTAIKQSGTTPVLVTEIGI